MKKVKNILKKALELYSMVRLWSHSNGRRGSFNATVFPCMCVAVLLFVWMYPVKGYSVEEGGRLIVDKKTLMDYIDICELIKEIEYEISRMRKIEMEHAKVVGSNPEFPYQKKSFHVSGVTETYLDQAEINKEKQLLRERKKHAKNLKHEIEKWMNTIPFRMQRIIKMKYFYGESWETIAARMGRNATADSVRKEFDRFMRKK